MDHFESQFGPRYISGPIIIAVCCLMIFGGSMVVYAGCLGIWKVLKYLFAGQEG